VQKAKLCEELTVINVRRGVSIIRENDRARSLFVIVSGRFDIRIAGQKGPVAEIAQGQPVGEIAFLAGSKRTATVTALRDSIVLKITRRQFDNICRQYPSIWAAMTTTLAKRLANANVKPARKTDPVPRTIAIIPAGKSPIPNGFVETFCQMLAKKTNTLVVKSSDLPGLAGRHKKLATGSIAKKLNELEARHDHIVYVADNELSQWSRLAVRQADMILIVGSHSQDNATNIEQNDIEKFAETMHRVEARRLVLVHPDRGPISGTMRWLENRTVRMHHHVNGLKEYQRLLRFILGEAVGLVACGGGAHCAAHIGLYQAMLEHGVTFDAVGGTSGGAAMTAAFAMEVIPDEIDKQTHKMFVTGHAMSKYNLPLFSILDHKNFDVRLRVCYGERNIEDLWIPYFAIATNLTTSSIYCQTVGKLWKAVRASASVPALLPPFPVPGEGMLVDGALMDNVPVEAMHQLKTGPNIVVNFEDNGLEIAQMAYEDIPSGWQMIKHLISRKHRKNLGRFPSASTVLMRSLNPNRTNLDDKLTDNDLLLTPAIPKDAGVLDWTQHSRLKSEIYDWTKIEIENLDPASMTILEKMLVK